MTSFEFVIPITHDDLLKRSGVKQYVVENIIIARHLASKLKDVEIKFRNEKADLIFSSFDFFFSVLIAFNQTTAEIKEGSWKLLFKILNEEINNLVLLLDQQLLANDKLKHLNIIKMTCYLLCQYGQNFEIAQEDIATLNTGKSKMKTAKKDVDSEMIDWNHEREAIAKIFLQLMQLNINKLWDPPIVEEDFVNLIGNFAYKILENPISCRNKALKDSIFNIIGIMVKRHSHILGCTLKILQLLQVHEHLVIPIAQMVELIAVQQNAKSFVSEILRELSKIDGEELRKDTSGTRAFSSFLSELGRLIPSLILPNLCLILPFLDMKEPYTMRNSVLSVMGDIIVKILNGENLDLKQKNSRDQLFDRLEDHLIDVNAYVRSKVLQIWLNIVSEKALPLPRRQNILVAAKMRIEDRSSQVRKYALQLIIALIKANPLAVQVSPDELAPMYKRELLKLEEMVNLEEKQADSVNNEAIELTKETRDDELKDQPISEVNQQKVLVVFLKESLEFIMEIYATIPMACEMLRYKSSSDVLESIDFFINGYECGVTAFLMGIKKMMFLVHSKETDVKEAVIGAYRRIYFNPKQSNIRQESITIASSILSLVDNCDYIGDEDALEKLIYELVKSEDITQGIIQVLWEKFSMKMPGTTLRESQAALNLLSMIASLQTKLVTSNLDIIISEGLGKRAEDNNLFARDTCKILLKLCVLPQGLETAIRYPSSHEIFIRIQQLLLNGFLNLKKEDWIPFADMAIPLIFKLSERPEEICENLIKSMAKFDLKTLDSTLVNMEEEEPCTIKSVPMLVLSRFLFFVGHVALNEFEHLDVSVFAELKRRSKLRELRCNKKKDSKEILIATSASSLSRSKSKNESKSISIEEEMGLGGAEVDDFEADFIKKITENEIVTNDQALLGKIAPFIIRVVRDQVKYNQPDVQTSAVLALAKFMITSSEFCEEHLPLLFTLLEKSQNQAVRCNIIISLSDIMYRMPNLIEPWTANIYARLRDRNLLVRRTAIILLTGLILHDMIKVKGQVSELGICLLDDDPDVSMIAKNFFAEFSKKVNSIYNILPDVISRLSDEATGVDEEKFRIILRILISYIQKEKQSESLVEKLCQRFRTTVLARGWRDIAFCISLLPANEKSIKKMQELFCCFADKLSDDFVYECFTTVITNAKKLVKENALVLITEFEQKLEEAHNKGVENEEVVKKANNAKTKNKRVIRTKKVQEEIESDSSEEMQKVKATRSSRISNLSKQPKPKLVFSSDEEDFKEDEQPKKKSAKIQMKNKLKKIYSDSDSSLSE